MSRSILSQFDWSDERLTELQHRLEQKRDEARDRTEEVVEDLQERSADIAGRLKDSSVATSCELGANTLSRAADLLEDVPGMNRRADRLRERADELQQTGRAVDRPPIDDYDALNVDEVNNRLEGLSSYQLEKVRRYEEAHKDRVTVLREVDRRLG